MKYFARGFAHQETPEAIAHDIRLSRAIGTNIPVTLIPLTPADAPYTFGKVPEPVLMAEPQFFVRTAPKSMAHGCPHY